MDETAEWPAQLPVPGRGAHRSVEHGACVMEYAALLSGQEHTDRPETVHPLLAALCRRLNDSVGDDVRAGLVRLAPALIGTAQSRAGDRGAGTGAIAEVLRRHLARHGLRVDVPRPAAVGDRLDPGAGGGTAVLDRSDPTSAVDAFRWRRRVLEPFLTTTFAQARSLCSDRAMVELLEEMVHEVRAAQGLPPVATSGPARTATPGVIDGIGGAVAD